ncbi:cAMP-dependent protein kinase regulator [Marchantia polymorpha subsp. ruderalis]|uniref:cGMP-dependent protein kinase n=1 Tax=Marchantia polymorpha TaxID=3197 RepID=A0A2R6X8A3_MARPO|nr:hypothetical protein MARPO_0030s0069 [Marchantia polymorpha]BBN20209.1 hypothetical protein Mp_8g17350 [Marchantia polymorpha subsp. ruderalis]|eukprot:PTQ42327.1 hypothetical protein MARPO_0030s0069 [Marchantia polymorpha]
MASSSGRDIMVGMADIKLKQKAKSISGPPPNVALRQRQRSKTLSFRRTGVSSSVKTVTEKAETKVVDKSEDAKKRIRNFFSKNYLLQHLDQEQSQRIVEAVEEVHFNEGDVIIHQGEPGEFFYLLEQGAAEVWMTKPGGKKPEVVKQYSSGDTFGELALLYNAPRAATVKATTDCVLWAMDRSTFRAILMTTTHEKRNLYEKFLSDVPLLKTLDKYERSSIADVLEPEYFSPQQTIIAEGAKGDKFYMIEEGEAEARSQGKVMMRYKRGDYFGELALLNDAPRAATVTALTKCKVVSINRDQFKRLLGKLEDILHRKKEVYDKANAAGAVSPSDAPRGGIGGAGPSGA